jgi:cephalosporin hydroxylase
MAFPASISPEAGLMLFSLVRNIRPRVVVEVGTFIGVSTLWIAAALEEAAADPGRAPGPVQGVIHCFDDLGPMAKGPWREAEMTGRREPVVAESIRRAGLSHRVVLHPGDSSTEIRKFRDQLRGTVDPFASAWGQPFVGRAAGDAAVGGVDLALIDGDHTVDGVLQDLWAVEPVINPGGYILLHDTFPEQCGDHQGPRHILDHIAGVAQGVYEVCELYTAPLNYGMALLRRVG